MKTDEEYSKLHDELRVEIGTRCGLTKELIEILPLTSPDLMRIHAERLANLAEVKATQPVNGDKAVGNVTTDSKTDLAKAIDKRLDTILNHYYKGPAPRTT